MPAPPDPEHWSPPADFVPVASAVEGVLLWAPKPEVEDDSVHARQTSKCPQCGASAAFDIKVGAMTCRFCGFTAESKAKTVGTSAKQNEFTLEAMALFDQGWGVERRELHCGECAANIAIEEGALTATCPFCDSNQMNVQTATQTGIRPKFLIPFTVEPTVVEGNLRKFLGQGWMFPGDLAPLAKNDRFAGIYLPFWVFDARMMGGWRAEIGHPHTVTTYSNGKPQTRTEIRYRWESGSAQDVVKGLLVPGTNKVSAKLAQRTERFELEALKEYDPSFLAGWRAMSYDLALPEAWTQGRARMREVNRISNYSSANSRTGYVRNFTMVADFEDERWRYVLLPMYVAAYHYEGKTFQVLVNGQNGEVSGQKPVAWWKIYTAIFAATLPAFFVGFCLGIPLTLFAGVGIIAMILGLVMFIGALWWGWGLWQRALDAEAA